MTKSLKTASPRVLSGVLVPHPALVLAMFVGAGCATAPPAKKSHQVHIVDVGSALAELEAQRQLAMPMQTFMGRDR